MVTYQEESWETLCPELTFLFEREHGQELRWRDSMVPSLNQELHNILAEAGCLHCVTARQGIELIGYFVTYITPHMYWKSTRTEERLLYGANTLYFVRIPFRHQGIGKELFIFATDLLRKKGVQVIVSGAKTFEGRAYLDYSPLFHSLDWTHLEHGYMLWLED